MDAVSRALQRHSGRDAFLLRCLMDPPWAIRIADGARLALLLAVAGDLVVVPDGAEPVALAAGDLVLVKGPRPYRLAGDAATTPRAVIEPGQVCRSLAPDAPHLLDARTWGTSAGAPTAFLTVTYELPAQVGGDLLDALDDVTVLRAARDAVPAAALLAAEFTRHEPGQDAVLDRLADVVAVGALREIFLRTPRLAPGWWRASADPVLAPALAATHDDPAHPWTVEELARTCGASRAAFARRFTTVVGEPPMAYVSALRLSEAADRLARTTDTLAAIARAVGYGTPFALSAAFTRRYGVPPRQWREQARAAAG
ncbi:MAG: AraC family transcriptional regulator [Kineosporiaceae bacterium]